MEEDERLFPGLLLLDLNSIESSLLFLLLLRFDKVPFTQIGGESRKMKRLSRPFKDKEISSLSRTWEYEGDNVRSKEKITEGGR